MRYSTLSEELDSITKDYDYGIVPGSAAVFVKDEILGIGRLDLTLLEGVIVVIEVSNQGYKIASSLPLAHDQNTIQAAEFVQSCVETGPYETMESLLMTISPLFKERFQATLYEKLHKVQQEQLLHHQQTLNHSSSINSPSISDLQQQHAMMDHHSVSPFLSASSPSISSSSPSSNISNNNNNNSNNNNNDNNNNNNSNNSNNNNMSYHNNSIQYQHYNNNNNDGNTLIPPLPTSATASDIIDEINQWIN
ncbi:hypothetical protein BJ944DRAFT_245989 [Cunninghamella echinulata]|nr:hypothetical protein BJ944DRAFT_245989 [Cunninghamella echinulata]